MDTARPALVGKAGDDAEAKLRRQLGGRIVALREAQGMSQIRLAKQLGIGRSRLSKWECGQHQPLLKHLHALARLLDVSLHELLTGGTAKPPAPGSQRPPRPRRNGGNTEPIAAASGR